MVALFCNIMNHRDGLREISFFIFLLYLLKFMKLFETLAAFSGLFSLLRNILSYFLTQSVLPLTVDFLYKLGNNLLIRDKLFKISNNSG